MVEKHNVQVFGTTHNDDMMRSALEAFAGKEGMLGLFRIDKRGDRHVMVSYNDEAMEAVLEVLSRCGDEHQDSETQVTHRRGA